MRNKIYTQNAPKPLGPYSQAILVDGTLYCSGQIPIDANSGELCGLTVKQQTRTVCENIKSILQSAGLGFENVVKTTCYLTEMDYFEKFNAVYAEYFISNPARSCVAVKALPKGALVEIEVIAV